MLFCLFFMLSSSTVNNTTTTTNSTTTSTTTADIHLSLLSVFVFTKPFFIIDYIYIYNLTTIMPLMAT